MEFSKIAANNEKSEDSQKIILQKDFKKYLKDRFQEYKKKSFSIEDMQQIKDRCKNITNEDSLDLLGQCLHRDVYDENQNTYVHLGILNRHLSLIEWAIGCMTHPLTIQNEAGKEPIDLCIDQLMPDALENNRERANAVFTTLVDGYSKIGFDYDHRKNFLKKIIRLEFEHIKHGNPFVLKEDMLKGFAKQDIQLSEIYQQLCDEEGNTFTHILVSHQLSDLLYNFYIKNYITFVTNKNSEDSLTLAKNNFSQAGRCLFEQCVPGGDVHIREEDNKKKCCYVMLLNILKKDNNADFKKCCDKHMIEKS
jgi:hypothetical protein